LLTHPHPTRTTTTTRPLPPPHQWLLTSVQETPGHCLALNGSWGAHVDVALRERIVPTAVSVEHLHRALAFDGRSAVRAFSLLGGGEEAEEAEGGGGGAMRVLLAQGVYDAAEGAPVQTFALPQAAAQHAGGVTRVRFQVLSNHGAEYTCLYRLRVHGRRPGGVNAPSA
jgi:SUN domain-containing protein 1/2